MSLSCPTPSTSYFQLGFATHRTSPSSHFPTLKNVLELLRHYNKFSPSLFPFSPKSLFRFHSKWGSSYCTSHIPSFFISPVQLSTPLKCLNSSESFCFACRIPLHPHLPPPLFPGFVVFRTFFILIIAYIFLFFIIFQKL
jgi:hypothetical protein